MMIQFLLPEESVIDGAVVAVWRIGRIGFGVGESDVRCVKTLILLD